MMVLASLAGIAFHAGWYFYALGPQMIICLWLGYLSARKCDGDLLNWLVAAFCASLVPLAGVLIMAGIWWRTGAGTTRAPEGEPPA